MIARRAVVVVTVAACSRDVPAPMQAPPAPAPQDATVLTLRWRPHAFGGVTFDVIDGVEVQDGENISLQFHRPVALGVWLGTDYTLAHWRQRFGDRAVVAPETAIRVCGRPGYRQEVTTKPDYATGMFAKPGGGFEERNADTPARVAVAIAGTTATNMRFVVNWVVDADHRDELRADEAHFLASIGCT